ncbi:MAG: hypothetical protein FJ338_01195 [Sphingomonadales bacterium]|nr:hypothetical protein [Sphingomonadales bacterium]
MLGPLACYEGAYTVAMRLYSTLIGLAATLGHRRAAALVQGRQHTEQYLRQAGNPQGYVWFHASSAGELEQALPLMQAWREQRPEDPILLSLYSPSAYRAGYCPPEADLCLMMSADLPEQVHQWINVLQPRLAIFIKYDYWYHHFRCLHQHRIPLYIACAKLPSQSLWLRPFARPLWSAMASSVSEFWVQDQSTLDLLASSGVPQAVICGDTRYDRVLKVAALPFEDCILHAFGQPSPQPSMPSSSYLESSPRPVMIGGSTWPEDHRWLLYGLVEQHHQISPKSPQNRWKLMLVPHEINPQQIQALNRLLQEISASMSTPLHWRFYSQINPLGTTLHVDLASLDVLIVDQKGLLSRLYRYGQAAWIGGGFGAGIHNVLEAAVYGLPVGFGPRYLGFTEAEALLERGFATAYTTRNRFRNYFDQNQGSTAFNFYQKAGGTTPSLQAQIKAFCQSQAGTTKRCLERINLYG